MNEDDLRLLIERTAIVETMTGTAGWDLLKDRASHNMAERQRRILNGGVTDLNEYKQLTGWLDGATFVLTLPERMQTELLAARKQMAEEDGAA